MPKRKEAVVVIDQSFWMCRICDHEVMFSDGLWRACKFSRLQGNWICKKKVEGWVEVPEPQSPPDDSYLTLLSGYKNYYHDAQELDPAADLRRIIADL